MGKFKFKMSCVQTPMQMTVILLETQSKNGQHVNMKDSMKIFTMYLTMRTQ
jgi:hypothetical protein